MSALGRSGGDNANLNKWNRLLLEHIEHMVQQLGSGFCLDCGLYGHFNVFLFVFFLTTMFDNWLKLLYQLQTTETQIIS